MQKGWWICEPSHDPLWVCPGALVYDFLPVWGFLGYAANDLWSFALLEEKRACVCSMECHPLLFNVALVAGEEPKGIQRCWTPLSGFETSSYSHSYGMDCCCFQSVFPFCFCFYWWLCVICELLLVYSLCTSASLSSINKISLLLIKKKKKKIILYLNYHNSWWTYDFHPQWCYYIGNFSPIPSMDWIKEYIKVAHLSFLNLLLP